MKKITYTEPSNYFPKSVRSKSKAAKKTAARGKKRK